ncbi:unnamed protein product [Alopecurus aequalis]
MVALEIYRRSLIGMGLTETLDEMVSSGRLDPDLAIRVLLQFDESMSAALQHKVTSRAVFKGHLRSYNNCDNVWTFNLRGVTFRNEEISENIGKVKMVACDYRLTKHEEQHTRTPGVQPF